MLAVSFSDALAISRDRLRSHWRLKLLMTCALGTFFCVPYFLLMYYPLRPPRTLPTTVLDDAFPFDARWIWVYQSIYLLINPLPWLATRRAQLARFCVGFVAVCCVSFAIFAIYPTACSRPDVADPRGMYWLLLLYDRKLNAFPSLHAGLLTYTLLFVRRLIREDHYWRHPFDLANLLFVGAVIWGILILIGAMFLKEHYAIDLLAGAALAVVADWFAWSKLVRINDCNNGRMSHVGWR